MYKFTLNWHISKCWKNPFWFLLSLSSLPLSPVLIINLELFYQKYYSINTFLLILQPNRMAMFLNSSIYEPKIHSLQLFSKRAISLSELINQSKANWSTKSIFNILNPDQRYELYLLFTYLFLFDTNPQNNFQILAFQSII